MKRFVWILAFLFLAACPAFAQGGAPQPGSSTSHFSVNASAMGFSGSTSASAATIAGGNVSITNRFALGYQQIAIPSESASFYLGEAQYTMPVCSLVGKKLCSKFVFNTSKWSVSFFAGAGVLRQTSTTTDPATGISTDTQIQRIAETAGVGLNYQADSHIMLQIVSGQWLHAGVQNQLVATPSTASIATGLKISF
jgi:hypothetical protein